MSYTPPAGNAANLTFQGLTAYTPPAGNVANLSFATGYDVTGVLVCVSSGVVTGRSVVVGVPTGVQISVSSGTPESFARVSCDVTGVQIPVYSGAVLATMPGPTAYPQGAEISTSAGTPTGALVARCSVTSGVIGITSDSPLANPKILGLVPGHDVWFQPGTPTTAKLISLVGLYPFQTYVRKADLSVFVRPAETPCYAKTAVDPIVVRQKPSDVFVLKPYIESPVPTLVQYQVTRNGRGITVGGVPVTITPHATPITMNGTSLLVNGQPLTITL